MLATFTLFANVIEWLRCSGIEYHQHTSSVFNIETFLFQLAQ